MHNVNIIMMAFPFTASANKKHKPLKNMDFDKLSKIALNPVKRDCSPKPVTDF